MLAGRSSYENMAPRKGQKKGRGPEFSERGGYVLLPTQRLEGLQRQKALKEADYTLELIGTDIKEIVANVQSIVKDDLERQKHKEVKRGIVESKKTMKLCKKVKKL